MTNQIMENGTYNLSGILSVDAIERPDVWWANFNIEMNGIVVISLLAAIGIILFFVSRLRTESDTEAGVYSGVIISFVGLLLFIISITGLTETKLLTWEQFFIFPLITGLFILADFISKRF